MLNLFFYFVRAPYFYRAYLHLFNFFLNFSIKNVLNLKALWFFGLFSFIENFFFNEKFFIFLFLFYSCSIYFIVFLIVLKPQNFLFFKKYPVLKFFLRFSSKIIKSEQKDVLKRGLIQTIQFFLFLILMPVFKKNIQKIVEFIFFVF